MVTRVLITGGAGFIGSHCSKLFAANGLTPIVYDNLSTGHREAVRWGPLVEGDILNTDRLADAICSHGAEAVVHFAASAYVGESVGDPAKYYHNNVMGSLSVMDACRKAGVKDVVFSSSCATYGVPDKLPIAENDPQNPINPYGATKLMAERALGDYAAAYGLHYVILRYFNACGADPEGELTERHDPETHLIPCALLAAAGELPHLTIFGNDYETADGTCIRDYIHVTDLARGHLLALQYLDSGGANLAVNLGSGRPTSVKEVVEAIGRITSKSVPVIIEPRRAGDPPALFADVSLAHTTLGFLATLSDIDSIIRTAAPSFGHLGPAPAPRASELQDNAEQRAPSYRTLVKAGQ